MGLSGILFNPQGRISPAEFWRGLIVLIGVSIVATVLGTYGPSVLEMIFGLISILLFYPVLCVYGKRFHDAGRTAWLAVLVGIGYLIFVSLFQAFLVPMLAPEFAVFQRELTEQLENQEIGFVDYFVELGERSEEIVVANIISTLVGALLAGFIVARLESDPDENEHGMPTSGSVEGTFE